MRKRILRVVLALAVFILLLSLPVRADEAELYQNSGADTLMEAMPGLVLQNWPKPLPAAI